MNDKNVLVSFLVDAGLKAQQIPELLNAAGEMCRSNDDMIIQLVDRTDLRQDEINIKLNLAALLPEGDRNAPLVITHDIPMHMRRRGIETRLVIGDTSPARPDATLLKNIARARIWVDDLIAGKEKSIPTIAKSNNVSEVYVANLLPIAFLAPEVVQAIIEGEQSADLTSDMITKKIKLPLVWEEQERIIGSGFTL